MLGEKNVFPLEVLKIRITSTQKMQNEKKNVFTRSAGGK